MESLSRPPHRRKHSATRNASSFSLKNPYDDVLLPQGGKAKFEANEYAEIFSGSSSIPVLDLSGLNDRVGSDDFRSSEPDYSNIFGELRYDDVAVPYEQLFNGALKKTKTRIPAEMDPPLQESGSIDSNSSDKTKSATCVASDQSVDVVKQHFNLSFNKTSQRNSNESNGKTHIAQLHAVPGFTHFVDGAPTLQKESNRPVPSMNHEVSRTWSFSSGVEAISSHSSVPNNGKDLRQSRLPSFASRDAYRKTVGECSPPLFDEDLDENSVAAETVAALKKAIEQAQESIRIAKMIMGKKKEGPKDGSKPRFKNGSESKDKKETGIQLDALKENNITETCQKSDTTYPMSNGVYGKSVPALSCNDNFLNVDKAKVEMVRENVEAAIDEGKKLPPFCCRSGILNADENVGMENGGQNVEAAEALDVVHEKCGTETFKSGKADNSAEPTYSTDEVRPCIEQMETGKVLKRSELTIHPSERPEVISIMEKGGPSTSQSVQEREMSADEAFEQCQVMVNHIEGPKSIGEGGNLRISQGDELTEKSDDVVDDKECEKKIVGHEELVGVEQLTVLKSESDSLPNGSRILVEKDVMERADMLKKTEDVSGWKENNQDGKSSDEWFESELQLTEPEEEIIRIELEIFAEVGINVSLVHELVDKKLNSEHDEDQQILPREHGKNDTGDRHMESSERVVAETMQMETNNYSEVQKCEVPESEESRDKFEFQEIDEAIDVHYNDSGTIFNETQEPCDVDLNTKTEEYQADATGCKENDKLPLENETFSAVEDSEAGEPIHLEINEKSETDSIDRCVSEEKFIESQPDSTFEGLSSVRKSDIGDLINADHEETMFTTVCETHNAAKEFQTAKNEGTKFDDMFVESELEQDSESNEESLFTSFLQSIVEVSASESQEYKENFRGSTSNKEEGKDHLVMTSDEREHVGEQSDTQLNCESKELDKCMNVEVEVETVQNIEKNKENLSRTSQMGPKDAKGSDKEFEADDQRHRIESIKRGREREKDRIVVERAIREARERAFAEARERAAVERAAAEVRKRGMGEKTSVENKQVDKVSNEARLRAERAAVERATTEARERALEKAMSQKTQTEARTQADKHSTERLSSSSRNNGLKHSFSSSDLKNVDGAVSESTQRRKARLDRHQRIMERAAKALAEKNMRDVLAQKEQAERNRLAESLDADVKRWAAGKQGNLRALLSTLQYILGPDSGWQPVPLTEIITTAAVKKAYRKATLCVHPDKLQQRGATIHQKYICEKVFDLLKAAWNRFNSEER